MTQAWARTVSDFLCTTGLNEKRQITEISCGKGRANSETGVSRHLLDHKRSNCNEGNFPFPACLPILVNPKYSRLVKEESFSHYLMHWKGLGKGPRCVNLPPTHSCNGCNGFKYNKDSNGCTLDDSKMNLKIRFSSFKCCNADSGFPS